MGGYNSGRHSGRPALDSGLTLSLSHMMRKKMVTAGALGAGSMQWSRNGEPIATIGYRYDLVDPDEATIDLSWTRTPYDGEPEKVEQRIRLSCTTPHYGGNRWWMHCPRTGARVATLYMPPGARGFACRAVWRLGYRSQRVARDDRASEKLFRLQRKMGTEQGWDNWGPRPKGMWTRTYSRNFERFMELNDQAQDEANIALIRAAARLGIVPSHF